MPPPPPLYPLPPNQFAPLDKLVAYNTMNRSTMTYLYQYIIPYIIFMQLKSVVIAETRVSKAPYSDIKAVYITA